MTIIQLLVGLAGIVAGMIGLITYRRHKAAGRNEAILEAARREAEQGKARGTIDSNSRTLNSDDLERRLREQSNP